MSTYQRPAVAADYDAHYRRRVDRSEDKALDRLLGDLEGKDVLDLGCGTCAVLDRHRHIRHYVGVDLSLPMLEKARQKHDRLRRGRTWKVMLGDASEDPATWRWQQVQRDPRDDERMALPFQFDLAVSLFAFSYFPDALQAMHSAMWALRPGGRVVIQAHGVRYRQREHCMDDDPFTSYGPHKLWTLAQQAGLEPVRVLPFGWLPDRIADLFPPALGQHLQFAPVPAAMLLPQPYSYVLEARKR